jgi:hypothetical protein
LKPANTQQQIELSVTNWAAWAPGLPDKSAWYAWADGEKQTILEPDEPDVKFVAPLMRRRLSSLSRMAFRVATDCLNSEHRPASIVFCSRYGEYRRSFEILKNLAAAEPASAAAFSMSVHNTAASLFAIENKQTRPTNAIAGGDATLETAFLEAGSLLNEHPAASVLVVYHDEPLPELYRNQPTTVMNRLAFAMLLQQPSATRNTIDLGLSWGTDRSASKLPKTPLDPALRVLKLLLRGGAPVILDTGRLMWTWKARNAAD